MQTLFLPIFEHWCLVIVIKPVVATDQKTRRQTRHRFLGISVSCPFIEDAVFATVDKQDTEQDTELCASSATPF